MGDFNEQDNNKPEEQNNQSAPSENPIYQQPQSGNQGGYQPQNQQPVQPQYQQPMPPQYQQPVTPQYQYQQNQQYEQPKQKPSNGMAIGSLVLGIVSIVLFCIPYVTIPAAIVGLILGIISLKNNKGSKGMAIAGIILAGIGLLFGIMIAVGVAAMFRNTDFMEQFTNEINGYSNTY